MRLLLQKLFFKLSFLATLYIFISHDESRWMFSIFVIILWYLENDCSRSSRWTRSSSLIKSSISKSGMLPVLSSIKSASNIFNHTMMLFISHLEANSVTSRSFMNIEKSSRCGHVVVFHNIISFSTFFIRLSERDDWMFSKLTEVL